MPFPPLRILVEEFKDNPFEGHSCGKTEHRHGVGISHFLMQI